MLIYRQKQTKQPSRAYLGVTDPRSVTSKFYIYTASRVVLFSRLGLVTVFLHPSVAASCQGRQILESCVLLPALRGHRTNQEPKLTQPSDREEQEEGQLQYATRPVLFPGTQTVCLWRRHMPITVHRGEASVERGGQSRRFPGTNHGDQSGMESSAVLALLLPWLTRLQSSQYSALTWESFLVLLFFTFI